jgi:hypothetical protein
MNKCLGQRPNDGRSPQNINPVTARHSLAAHQTAKPKSAILRATL